MRCSRRNSRSPLLRLTGLATALVGLASCGMFNTAKQFPCPSVGMPRETATLTRFREGPGRDLTDVIYEAGIADVKMACTYTSSGVDIELGVVLAAERGPANTSRTATVPYYIAIVDPQRNILAKEVFSTTLSFQQNVSRAAAMDETQEKIPLPKGQSAERYGVVLGMQLTPEEVEYNRNKALR